MLAVAPDSVEVQAVSGTNADDILKHIMASNDWTEMFRVEGLDQVVTDTIKSEGARARGLLS